MTENHTCGFKDNNLKTYWNVSLNVGTVYVHVYSSGSYKNEAWKQSL